jgi:TRAP-type uncharacterized transport system substrate-binding protein
VRKSLLSIVAVSLSLMAAPAWSQAGDERIELAQAVRVQTPTAATVGEQDNAARVNNWTVGVAGGLLEGTFIRFAAELAKVLDDGDNMRVIPMVTYGAGENISDLLYLKGVDIAITDADVFEEYKKNHRFSNIDQRINYISEMYISEFHVYARPEIKSMRDLEGKKVGFNSKGSAANITGKIVFERLGINVEPVFVNNSIAVEQMRSGELAALLHTVGKPNDFFKKEDPSAGFHFLSVEYSSKFSDYYLPSTLTSEDYPNLLKPGESVDTIGVPVVLAVYNWARGTERFRRVERFIQSYFERFEALRKPPFHPKWREINLAAKVPGWTRYWVAEQMVSRIAGTPPPGPAAPASTASTSAPLEKQSDPLYREFLEWKKKQQRK